MKLQTLTSISATAVASLLVATVPAHGFEIKSRDEAPDDFQNILPELSEFVGKEARELDLETIGAHRINLSAFELKYDHSVKAYFIGETAGGYRNQLDFRAWMGDTIVQEQTKIFGDTSCSPSEQSSLDGFSDFCANPNTALAGSSAQDSPLNVGDFVELGDFKAGTVLDFLLVANGRNGGVTQDVDGQSVDAVYGVDTAANPDGKQHAMGYFYKDFLIVGYEDLWGGGDGDFNDVVFAIDFGAANNREIGNTSVPEPSTVLGLSAIAGALALRRRRSRS
ncbi:hypothetical protein CKA32_001356 [Geitlerinema sp. FC II]|nr:DUF4114 domain-containing protein [Geitlerinema sp. CS-897]PPT09113.1 hypothetical protein CKA32_001356 [Geitlerinema sp. FC II]